MKTTAMLAVLTLGATVAAPLQEQPAWNDPSSHRMQFVMVDESVRLEVLDWGGPGRSLLLIPGLGNTAHVFDDFAKKLSSNYHVYGITRRGYGASSVPDLGYRADRLGDDVLAVMDALKLDKPVLIGHSIGGTELSSIGSRHPDRVAGLVYLDAGYQYAFDNGRGTPQQVLREALREATSTQAPPNPSDLASYQALQAWYLRENGITFPEAEWRQLLPSRASGLPGARHGSPGEKAIPEGIQKYTDIRAPILAIFALPHDLGPWFRDTQDTEVRKAAEAFAAKDRVLTGNQVKAFEDGLPNAQVLTLSGAHHFMFLSHEAAVLSEIRAFVASLP